MLSTEPRFARQKGRVHVLGDAPVRSYFEGEMELGETLARMPIGRTLCGKDITQSLGGDTAHEFPDEDLCIRCHSLWPHPKNLLFEHPTGETDGDG